VGKEPGVFGRRDRYITNLDDTGQANWVKSIGADLIRGHARLDGPRRVAAATPDDQIAVLCARRGRTAERPTAVRCRVGSRWSAVAVLRSK
jgi:hypothetical protein